MNRWHQGALAVMCMASAWVHGQSVELTVRVAHGAFVTGEPASIVVRLTNRGATPIVIDDHELYRDNRLVLALSGASRHGVVEPLRPDSIVADLMLAQDETFTQEIALADWYPLLPEGRHYVTAVLFHNGRRYESDRRLFDVVPGLELARLSTAAPGQPGRERLFKLVYLARDQREFVFLRSEDAPQKRVWTTLRLGPIVRLTPPSLAADPAGTILVRHQATRNRFQVTRIRSEADGLRVLNEQQELDASATPLVHAMNEAVLQKQDASQKQKVEAGRGSPPASSQRPAPTPGSKPAATPENGW